MKLNDVLENVVDINSRLDQKKDQEYAEIEQAKEKVLSEIDYAANGAIEQFKSMGIDPDTATKTVIAHLSDLVMMHDMQNRLK